MDRIEMEIKDTIPPRDLLYETATKTRVLANLASEMLHRQKDPNAYHEILKQRAELIAVLPEEVGKSLKTFGGRIKERDLREIKFFANLAKEALEPENKNLLSVILSPSPNGKTVNEPNDFEELVERIYPKKKPRRTLSKE